MIYFETWNIYLLFKHCCYCFVQWTIYNWIFCRKVNRKYKHNTSCTLNNHRRPYWRTRVRWHLTESSKIITPKCHKHRRLYRRTCVRRHLTESSKIITPKCHNPRRLYRRIYRRLYRRINSIGKLSVGKFYRQKYQRNVWIPKGVNWMHLWPCQITYRFTDGPRKIWRAIKKFGGKFKLTDKFVYLLPKDLKNE